MVAPLGTTTKETTTNVRASFAVLGRSVICGKRHQATNEPSNEPIFRHTRGERTMPAPGLAHSETFHTLGFESIEAE